MSAVNAFRLTEELKERYELQRSLAQRELFSIESDIEHWKMKTVGKENSFFAEMYIPQLKADAEKARKRVRELDTYIDTIEVFLRSNEDLQDLEVEDTFFSNLIKNEKEWDV